MPEEGEEAAVAGDGTPSIDPEIIRKLEEFKRQMFDPSHRAEREEPAEGEPAEG